MSKLTELEKDFDKWLGDEFDNEYKETEGETHRYIFCVDGNKDIGEPYDCACCISAEPIEKCNCKCHKRIKQIAEYFYNKITAHEVAILDKVRAEMPEADAYNNISLVELNVILTKIEAEAKA